jgi:hypothetical protein
MRLARTAVSVGSLAGLLALGPMPRPEASPQVAAPPAGPAANRQGVLQAGGGASQPRLVGYAPVAAALAAGRVSVPRPAREPDYWVSALDVEGPRQAGLRHGLYVREALLWCPESGAVFALPEAAALAGGGQRVGAIPPNPPGRVLREAHALPKGTDGAIPSLGGLAMSAESIFLGRPVGIVDAFRGRERLDGGTQYTTYLIAIKDEIKLRPRRRGQRFVRLCWPGGYLDGGEETHRLRLLRPDTDYVFLTRTSERTHLLPDGRVLVRPVPEEVPSAGRVWGWLGLPIVRVADGVLRPPFAYLEEAHLAAQQEGLLLPVFNIDGDPFPVWGGSYLEYAARMRHAVGNPWPDER